MSYLDESIIAIKNESKRLEKLDISHTVEIDNELYDFGRRKILDDLMSLLLPTSFTDMADNIAAVKYPSQHRPDQILTNESGTINFIFNHLEDFALTKESLPELIMKLRAVNKTLNPADVSISSGELQGVYFFDYRGYGLDADVYNFCYVLSINKALLLGGFNCPYDIYKDWKTVVHQIVQSIEIECM